MQVYQKLAKAFVAYHNCQNNHGRLAVEHYAEWVDIWRDRIDTIMREDFPSGSGVDTGTLFDWEFSKKNRLVLSLSFHHMNGDGYYDGWTEHKIVITPDLADGFEIKVTGQNRNDIKSYLADLIHGVLTKEFGEYSA